MRRWDGAPCHRSSGRSQAAPWAGRIVVPIDEPALKQMVQDLLSGTITPDDAVASLRRLPFTDLGFAKVDHHRALRQRCGEAVYAPGKTPEQCAAIVSDLLEEPGDNPVLITRADADQVGACLDQNPN